MSDARCCPRDAPVSEEDGTRKHASVTEDFVNGCQIGQSCCTLALSLCKNDIDQTPGGFQLAQKLTLLSEVPETLDSIKDNKLKTKQRPLGGSG